MSRWKLSLYSNAAAGFDPDNRLNSPSPPASHVPVGKGLSPTLRAVKALIGGAAVASVQQVHTFAPSTDTYRDLNPDGSWTFTGVSIGAAAPTVPAGALRVGVCRTDGADVTGDVLLCSYFWSSQDTDQPNQAAAQAEGNSLAAQLEAAYGHPFTALVSAL